MAEKTDIDLGLFIANEYSKVVSAVGLITGNRQDAPDAVQDAIVGYLSKPPARQIENLAAWITVVACNRLRDSGRSKNAEARAVAKYAGDSASSSDSGNLIDVDIAKALALLPPQQHEICVLHYLMDLSVSAIAEGLGVSESTVKTQLQRARNRLANEIRKEDHRG
ncbi:MAG: sigma-70 family RNA polymerase sigma factor [Microbacteriaceae bacterium]|nr:sigma-70 family RNA polymerase sigma factor [Microbacteriaceae bacterium]